MDYKINIVESEIELKDVLIDDVPDILFGLTSDGITVFDATEYVKRAEENAVFNLRVFMRACRPFVDSYIFIEGLPPGQLFYQNTNGHALIHSSMVHLFLAYVDRIWLAYFDNLISDVLKTGIAYSDTFLLKQIMERVPTVILEKIIKTRNEEDGESDNEQPGGE